MLDDDFELLSICLSGRSAFQVAAYELPEAFYVYNLVAGVER